jgi:hypothetical protein
MDEANNPGFLEIHFGRSSRISGGSHRVHHSTIASVVFNGATLNSRVVFEIAKFQSKGYFTDIVGLGGKRPTGFPEGDLPPNIIM